MDFCIKNAGYRYRSIFAMDSVVDSHILYAAELLEKAHQGLHYTKQYATDGLTGEGLELMKAIKRQVLADLAEDVAEYPSWVVSEACRGWRRSDAGKFRPSIS